MEKEKNNIIQIINNKQNYINMKNLNMKNKKMLKI